MSRTFSDFNSVSDMLEGVSKMYEEYLKQQHPDLPQISYDLRSLICFISAFADLSVLIYDQDHNMYKPYTLDWLKEKLYKKFAYNSYNKVKQELETNGMDEEDI